MVEVQITREASEVLREEYPPITRNAQQIDRVRAILMHVTDNTGRGSSLSSALGAISVIEWLQGNDDALEEYGIGSNQWE